MNNIKSIDIIKGISVLCIIFLNSVNYWLIINEELKYIIAYISVLSEIFGSMLFTFTYLFETIFTLQKMMGSPPERTYRNQIFKRSLLFILFGLLYNLIVNLFNGFTFRIWGWNFILFIGFAQIIVYFSFKLIRWARLVIGLLILIFTPFLRDLLYLNRNCNIISEVLYLIFVSSDPMFSLLPYASFCFFASIFSELIYQAHALENKRALNISIKATLRIGITFIIGGFALSLTDFNPLITPTYYDAFKYPFIDSSPILRYYSFQYIPYMPEFLLEGTPAYVLFISGVLIITLGAAFYFSETSTKNSRICYSIKLYGENSMTLIFMQYIFLPLFIIRVNIFVFFPLYLLFIILLNYLIYIWKKYANSKYSIEWIIEKATIKKGS
jgi:hypothetical protein